VQSLLFDDYKIESLNNGEISFKINCDNLNRALKSGMEATEVIMKLTKKGSEPFLNFTIQKVFFIVLFVRWLSGKRSCEGRKKLNYFCRCQHKTMRLLAKIYLLSF